MPAGAVEITRASSESCWATPATAGGWWSTTILRPVRRSSNCACTRAPRCTSSYQGWATLGTRTKRNGVVSWTIAAECPGTRRTRRQETAHSAGLPKATQASVSRCPAVAHRVNPFGGALWMDGVLPPEAELARRQYEDLRSGFTNGRPARASNRGREQGAKSEGNPWIPCRVRDAALGRGGRPKPPVFCETTSSLYSP